MTAVGDHSRPAIGLGL